MKNSADLGPIPAMILCIAVIILSGVWVSRLEVTRVEKANTCVGLPATGSHQVPVLN